MKKRAFTLVEMLISLSIVGVLAALSVPLLINRPDSTKAMAINKYNQLAENIDEMANNPMWYQVTYDENRNPNCGGLGCTAQPQDGRYNDNTYQDNTKFRNLLAVMYGVEVDNGTFTTSDGTVYTVSTTTFGTNYPSEPNDDKYREDVETYLNQQIATISIQLQGQDEDEAFDCIVTAAGDLRPADNAYLLQAYLEHPDDLTHKHDDEVRANELRDGQ